MSEPRVSERDREYFRRIGEWKVERHREERERGRRLTMREKILNSLSAAEALGMVRGEERKLADIDAF